MSTATTSPPPPEEAHLPRTKMTTRYTPDEWERIISSTASAVLAQNVTSPKYPVAAPISTSIPRTVDHTLLKLDSTSSQIDALCAEARVHNFATVCVRVNYVSRCVNNLKGSGVGVACVIGFHEGTYDLYAKLAETKEALEAGASELDVVINVPDLQAKEYEKIYTELSTLRQAAAHPVLLKLILETSRLSDGDIVAAAVLASAANFDYIKTSTGFLGPNSGATVPHVQLMKRCCEQLLQTPAAGGQRAMKVKASGGVRTLEDATKMLEAGAERLGTSGGVWIAKEASEAVEAGQRSGTPPKVDERPALQTRLFTDY